MQKGQLTISLAKKVNEIKGKFKVFVLDISAGPYKGDLQILKKNVQKERLEKVIMPIKGDVRDTKAIEDESIDLIISNELFGDLDRKRLESAPVEFYRILKPNRQMARGELNLAAENEAQRLLIEAKAYSLETSHHNRNGFRHSPMKLPHLCRK
jgi:ubiquinone/menaquinone biosynthesis C-methylase UbiE